jgi:CDP-paratose 2-epimerase
MRHETILITGGAGFVGSNLAVSFKRKYSRMRVIVMDNLKRRGSELNLSRIREHDIEFYHGDIRCPEDFPSADYDAMVECSAEPSVLAGYDGNPMHVVNTNLTGTINCLEEARKRKADVVFLSTSRVYPYDRINALEIEERDTRFVWKAGQELNGWSEKGIAEEFPLAGPRSIYGASKLCSEYILQEYVSMYGLRGVINRCGVIAGPWQFGKVDQGVFALWMLAHYFKRDGLKYIGYGGKGKQVRDLLHVDDLFELIDTELECMDDLDGKAFNVGGGGGVSLSLCEATDICREITGNGVSLGSIHETRPADLMIYITDNTAITAMTGWAPRRSGRRVLEDIRCWIEKNEAALRALTAGS